MELEFWGVRGTVPVSGKDRLKYGGHTPCAVLKSSSGDAVIVDAGTGIKKLGEKWMAEAPRGKLRLHLFLTHFHLDHIIGLPFFAPLYSSRVLLTFYSPVSPVEAERYLGGLMRGRYFPVDFRQTVADKKWRKLEEGRASVGSFEISHCPLLHPQGSVAYRVEEGGRSVVFATDTEPPDQGLDERLASFIREADYFIYDALFTPEEYVKRQGWGHSTWQEGVKLARRAGVKNLILSHFNPDHEDGRIDEMVELARREFPRAAAAREGLCLRM
ncbi:MAG: MBL fold metallo-hydrolase [Acidobacteriota bacterium]